MSNIMETIAENNAMMKKVEVLEKLYKVKPGLVRTLSESFVLLKA